MVVYLYYFLGIPSCSYWNCNHSRWQLWKTVEWTKLRQTSEGDATSPWCQDPLGQIWWIWCHSTSACWDIWLADSISRDLVLRTLEYPSPWHFIGIQQRGQRLVPLPLYRSKVSFGVLSVGGLKAKLKGLVDLNRDTNRIWWGDWDARYFMYFVAKRGRFLPSLICHAPKI